MDVLKGVWHEIFNFSFFSWISVPQALEYSIGAVSNFVENLKWYSRTNVYYSVNNTSDELFTSVKDTGD